MINPLFSERTFIQNKIVYLNYYSANISFFCIILLTYETSFDIISRFRIET